MKNIKLIPESLSLEDLRLVHNEPVAIELPMESWKRINGCHASLKTILKNPSPAYGINTGFGKMAKVRIADEDLSQLQHNLVCSHAAGVGTPINENVVRLAMMLKATSLAQGYSGVRPEIVERLIFMIKEDLIPVVPEKGSVGASGDLAPLAHMCLPIIGEGEVFLKKIRMHSKEALEKVKITPLVLEAKEGLSLLNGTQISTALALEALFHAENNLYSAIVIGSMSVDAALGSYSPFDDRIHQIRKQKGQIIVAKIFRQLLADSEINQSHIDCDRVQDPYCLRCQPQVLGACLDQLMHSKSILTREANSVSDNPLIFSKTNEVISGGNFHAEPVALVADNIAVAISEIGALSERRTAMLIDSSISELPPFLTRQAGLESGFMIAHVTAAALASENKSLAHPASVDSLPTSANQEDHVSMATFAARRLKTINKNTANILAIEYLAAAQGVDLRHPLKSSSGIESAKAILRNLISPWIADRVIAADIEIAEKLIQDGVLMDLLQNHFLE